MSEEGFLSRWSRRKRAVEAGRPVEEPAPPPPGAAPAAAPPAVQAMPPVAAQVAAPIALPAAEAPEECDFDPASLPPVDSLTIESDITAFLRKGVPDSLKRAALRRAWSLDPAIRDFVGPADYAWDFNAPDGVPGFALELQGDVKELLAQVFRAAEEEPARDAPAEEATAEAPQEEPAEAQAVAALPPAMVPPALEPPAMVPPAMIPPAEAPPAEAPAAAEAAEDPPAPRRRHGGAMPS
jgi:hypothetical protein